MLNRFTCGNPDCNAFIGYEGITEGVFKAFCKKCKSWTTVKVVKVTKSSDIKEEHETISTERTEETTSVLGS